MELGVKPGKYVVAVSGGVDSMVLLDLLSKLARLDLVIAHFNHGIREDADADEELVLLAARKYKLPVEVGYGNLGPKASEEKARTARYNFLNSVQQIHQAKAIITAHHQDDLIETALINILRGTGPQGLIAISSNPNILRPMLGFSKKQIYAYAKKNKLAWNEDTTNAQTDYLRNYLRQNLISKLSKAQRQQMLGNIEKIAKTRGPHSQLLNDLSKNIYKNGVINRSKFNNLPSEVGNELLVFWLRQRNIKDFDQQLINRANLLIRTAQAGTQHDLKKGLGLSVTKLTAQFTV